MVNLVGMDAVIFLRFTRMCRNIFVLLSVLGCAILIPINYTNSAPPYDEWLMRITPKNVWGSPQWATVVFAYLLTIIVCGFLWWNYKKVVQLRRTYMKSDEYQQSLHARTLMVRSIFSSPSPQHVLTETLAVRHPQKLCLGRRHRPNHRSGCPKLILLENRRRPRRKDPARSHRPAR